MSDLYSSLFKWAHRQDENFLTDAFAFILKRLLASEPELGRQFVMWMCFGKEQQTGFVGELKVATQTTIKEGRPDIWIRGENSLALVEVKKGSGLGDRQMERYREILEKSNATHCRLVLLTHYTVDFGDDDVKPDISVRWGEVATQLNQIPAVCPITKFLIGEFITFLRSDA